MTTREAVIVLAACPRCGQGIGQSCTTATGRNHTQRVHAALAIAIEQIPAMREPASVADLGWISRL